MPKTEVPHSRRSRSTARSRGKKESLKRSQAIDKQLKEKGVPVPKGHKTMVENWRDRRRAEGIQLRDQRPDYSKIKPKPAPKKKPTTNKGSSGRFSPGGLPKGFISKRKTSTRKKRA